jgi:hypothetical protein
MWRPDEQATASRLHIWRPQSLRPSDPDPSQAEGERKVTRGAPQAVEGDPRIHLPSACRFSPSHHPPRDAQRHHGAPSRTPTTPLGHCFANQTTPGTGRPSRPCCGASAPAGQAPESRDARAPLPQEQSGEHRVGDRAAPVEPLVSEGQKRTGGAAAKSGDIVLPHPKSRWRQYQHHPLAIKRPQEKAHTAPRLMA